MYFRDSRAIPRESRSSERPRGKIDPRVPASFDPSVTTHYEYVPPLRGVRGKDLTIAQMPHCIRVTRSPVLTYVSRQEPVMGRHDLLSVSPLQRQTVVLCAEEGYRATCFLFLESMV